MLAALFRSLACVSALHTQRLAFICLSSFPQATGRLFLGVLGRCEGAVGPLVQHRPLLLGSVGGEDMVNLWWVMCTRV